MAERPSILCVGIYLADKPNTASQTSFQLNASRDLQVTQRWTALTMNKGVPEVDVPATISVVQGPAARCSLLDRMLYDATTFDWVLIVDDDIEVPPGFLDALVHVARGLNFAICQPARTPDSYIDHVIVRRHPGLVARRSQFVEIGPAVLLRNDALAHILPFGENGMGWGLDFVWPVRMNTAGLRMGIVDAVPIAHRMRPPAGSYSWSIANHEMARTLAREQHLKLEEAFRIVEAYPWPLR